MQAGNEQRTGIDDVACTSEEMLRLLLLSRAT